jgi:hypothetical protein
MPDVRRNIADILTLFADNTAGDISAQDLRDFVVSVYGTGALFTGATQSASFTAAVGQIYPVNLSAATANIDVTFPSSPAAGDTFGFFVSVASTTVGSSGFAQDPYWGVEPLATTSINGVSFVQSTGDGVGRWGLMLVGEVLIFQWDAVSSTWIVVRDGRKPAIAKLTRITSAITVNSADVWTDIVYNSSDIDTWKCHNTTTGYFQVKRSNCYFVSVGYGAAAAISDQHYAGVRVWDGTTPFSTARLRQSSASGLIGIAPASITPLVPADTDLRYQFVSQTANRGYTQTIFGDSGDGSAQASAAELFL